MASLSRTLTIALALLAAIVYPCNGQGQSAQPPGSAQSTTSLEQNNAVTNAKAPGAEIPEEDVGGEAKPVCVVEEVIVAAGKHVQELVENVNRITATELLEHQRLNKNGKVIAKEHRKFSYVATIEETQPGMLNVDEYRDGSGGLSGFPGEMATVGMPSLALIFHSSHREEFEMVCEGMEEWRGKRAWKVRFEQRLDRPATMSGLQIGGREYDILLKGKAWIDAENYQIVHLETDLLRPIPEARLYTEHQVLDYGPVQFARKKQRLWLPLDAEIYLDAGGKQYYHRHVFSDYRIFAVDSFEKVEDPKQEE